MTSFDPNVMQGAVKRVLARMMEQLKLSGIPEDHVEVIALYDDQMDSKHGRLCITPKTIEGGRLSQMFNQYMNDLEKTFGEGIVKKMPTSTVKEIIK